MAFDTPGKYVEIDEDINDQQQTTLITRTLDIPETVEELQYEKLDLPAGTIAEASGPIDIPSIDESESESGLTSDAESESGDLEAWEN